MYPQKQQKQCAQTAVKQIFLRVKPAEIQRHQTRIEHPPGRGHRCARQMLLERNSLAAHSLIHRRKNQSKQQKREQLSATGDHNGKIQIFALEKTEGIHDRVAENQKHQSHQHRQKKNHRIQHRSDIISDRIGLVVGAVDRGKSLPHRTDPLGGRPEHSQHRNGNQGKVGGQRIVYKILWHIVGNLGRQMLPDHREKSVCSAGKKPCHHHQRQHHQGNSRNQHIEGSVGSVHIPSAFLPTGFQISHRLFEKCFHPVSPFSSDPFHKYILSQIKKNVNFPQKKICFLHLLLTPDGV